ncbi:DEAD/DEAH box helicase [Erysipelothrix urinaevulpis]|uniref:DEAD/DEAH box helicase n=1 Tax=Erysipelothrix urinaevulpis TaxID=2683717 RepID=UPI0013579675|nr:DEAD/DEAH box helicase [Erysipelothrix urinaevulpis]
MKFNELGLNKDLLQAVKDLGYVETSEIQSKAIPPILNGKDVLGLAQTGTGKTAAFALPTIQNLMKNHKKGKRKIRSLVLAPTRELAIQVYDSFKAYSKYTPLKTAVIYGGVGQGAQVRSLQQGVDILVATPGRLFDLKHQGFVNLGSVEVFILDEADRMLDMGFINDIKKTIHYLPDEKQSLLFSATMPKEINEIVEEIMDEPVHVAVTPVSSTVDKISQDVYFVDKENKISLLIDVIKKEEYKSFLIFTRTKRNADKVSKALSKNGIKSQAIHGDKSQNARQRALNEFKAYKIQTLVATDIAARGIDVDELDYVINYELPEEAETYVHRIGRTGRKGQDGASISFCSYSEIPLLKDIERLIKKKINVIHDHNYPLENKTVPKKGRGNKARGQQSTQTTNKRKRQPNRSSEKGQGKKDGRTDRQGNRNKSSKGKRRNDKKKQLGPYDWSNHKPKKKNNRKR